MSKIFDAYKEGRDRQFQITKDIIEEKIVKLKVTSENMSEDIKTVLNDAIDNLDQVLKESEPEYD